MSVSPVERTATAARAKDRGQSNQRQVHGNLEEKPSCRSGADRSDGEAVAPPGLRDLLRRPGLARTEARRTTEGTQKGTPIQRKRGQRLGDHNRHSRPKQPAARSVRVAHDGARRPALSLDPWSKDSPSDDGAKCQTGPHPGPDKDARSEEHRSEVETEAPGCSCTQRRDAEQLGRWHFQDRNEVGQQSERSRQRSRP